jgi:hypothetical protein
MIQAQIQAVLHKAPQQRISKNGNEFVIADVRMRSGEGVQFVKVFAFSEHVRTEIMRLGEGETLTVQGPLDAKLYEGERGPRVSLSLTADYALGLRQPPKERKKKVAEPARQVSEPAKQHSAEGPNDDVPF